MMKLPTVTNVLGEEVGLKYNQRSMAEEVLGEQEKKKVIM